MRASHASTFAHHDQRAKKPMMRPYEKMRVRVKCAGQEAMFFLFSRAPTVYERRIFLHARKRQHEPTPDALFMPRINANRRGSSIDKDAAEGSSVVGV